jgi:hypothetical protein
MTISHLKEKTEETPGFLVNEWRETLWNNSNDIFILKRKTKEISDILVN